MKSDVSCLELFDQYSEAVSAVRGGVVAYMNPAAVKLFGDEKKAPEKLFPELLLNSDKMISGAVPVGDAEFPATAVTFGEFRVVTVFCGTGRGGDREQNRLSSAILRMKNGLSVFQMSTSLIRTRVDGLRDEKLSRDVAILDRCCHKLVRFVDNAELLFLRGGEESLNVSCVDLCALCGNLCDSVNCVSGRGPEIVFECSESEYPFHCDPDMIERMLLNLFSNSLKYTPEDGAIRLTLRRTDGGALLSVGDSGKGVQKSVMPSVFSRFGEKTALEDSEEGLGFGLQVVQRIARRHGGSAVLESREGRGTTVTVLIRDMGGGSMMRNSLPQRSGSMSLILTELSDVLSYESYYPKNED